MDQIKGKVHNFAKHKVPEKFVLRRMGYPPGSVTIPETIREITEKMYSLSEDLMNPVGVYSIFSITEISSTGVMLGEEDIEIKSANIAGLLKKSEFAVLFMVTIGKSLEQKVAELSNSGNMTDALILDAIGSETADYAADILHKQKIAGKAEKEGFKVTPRFSPGYGDWELSAQKDILRVCGGNQIGISVSDNFMMSPQKSVSAVFGLVKSG